LKPRLHGLYVITDSGLLAPERLVSAVAEAITGGARVVQYRDKSDDFARRVWEVQDLVTLCRPLGVPVIVNDDLELARAAEADGVHLGQGDAGLKAARTALGPEAIIGITCHGELELARAATAGGADYLAFGRFFPSQSKPGAKPASLEVLRAARSEFTLPLVAIGGITPENGAQLIEAGADMLAVIHGVFGQTDVTAAARRYAELFE